MATAHTNEELAAALKRRDDKIEISGDMRKQVITLKASGDVAWAIAFAAIAMSAYALYTMLPSAAATGGASTPAHSLVAAGSAGGAVAVLGLPATMAAIGIVKAARSPGVLSALRNEYEIAEEGEVVVLTRVKS